MKIKLHQRFHHEITKHRVKTIRKLPEKNIALNSENQTGSLNAWGHLVKAVRFLKEKCFQPKNLDPAKWTIKDELIIKNFQTSKVSKIYHLYILSQKYSGENQARRRMIMDPWNRVSNMRRRESPVMTNISQKEIHPHWHRTEGFMRTSKTLTLTGFLTCLRYWERIILLGELKNRNVSNTNQTDNIGQKLRILAFTSLSMGFSHQGPFELRFVSGVR